MLRDFFASPNFLALLRFWDSARAGANRPDWNGELSSIPADLLPRLVIVERHKTLTYRYLGIEKKRQFGRDPTGATIAATLSPEYAAYITDLIETSLAGAAPVFSCSILHRDNLIKRTGRLVAPFTLRGSPSPTLIMSAHLVAGDEFKVTEVVEPGGVLETERVRIAGVPAVCARLEEIGRYHQLSQAMPDRGLAKEWDRIAASLGPGCSCGCGGLGTHARRTQQTEGGDESVSLGCDLPHHPRTSSAASLALDLQGFDAGKKVTGRKRHTLADTLVRGGTPEGEQLSELTKCPLK
jgi:hypothetical protein